MAPTWDIAELLDLFSHEGKPTITVAPLAPTAADLPPTWVRAVTASDPVAAVFDEVWRSGGALLPKTVKLFRRTTQAMAVLTTDEQPPSLLYITTGDGNTYARRGFPARPVPQDATRGLPADFLGLYEIHDGWLDDNSMMGWLPCRDWHPLGTDPDLPSSRFLVTFEGHGPATLGFDLEETPPSCWRVWNNDDPERVKNVSKDLDGWLSAYYEDLDVRDGAKRKPMAKAKPKR